MTSNYRKTEEGLEIDIVGGNPEVTSLPADPIQLDTVTVFGKAPPIGRDDVDQFTYHLKLFMADPLLGTINPVEKYIIAESGSTDIFIQDLNLKSVLSYNSSTYTTSVLDMTFKLIEPGGCSLLDRIASVADELNMLNFVKTPYFLEISFRGRDAITGEPLNSVDTKRTIPILILKNEIEITSSGTTYNIKAVYYNDTGTSDQLAVVQNPISIEGITTVSGALNKIAEVLNERKKVEATGNSSNQSTLSDVYEFVIDPKILENNGDLIVRQAIDEQAHKNANMGVVDFTQTTITLSDGTSLNRCIDQLMSVCSYMIKEPQLQEGKVKKSANADTNLYKVDVAVTIIGENKTLNDYYKKITYTIVAVKYKDPEIVDYDEIDVFKTYNYIFTGLNTEVLNFDCKLNTAWYIPLPRLSTSANVSSTQLGVLSSKNVNDVINSETEQSRADAMVPNPSVTDNAVGKSVPTVPTTTLAPVSSGDFGLAGNRSNLFAAGRQAIPSVNVPSTSKIIQGEQVATREIRVPAPTTSPKSTIAPSYTHYGGETGLQGAIEAGRDNSRSYVANMFDRTISDPNDADLLQIKFSVRGDPKWLNIGGTDSVFIEFNLGVPMKSAFEAKTDTYQSYKNRIISGIYRVLEITNNFEGGRYTQDLNCVKILRKEEDPNDDSEKNDAPVESGKTTKKGETGSRNQEAEEQARQVTNKVNADAESSSPTTTADLVRARRSTPTATTTQTTVPILGTKPVEQAKE